MNKRDVDELSEGNYKVKRRRNTRSFTIKENVPETIFN